MNSALSSLAENYQWLATLYAIGGLIFTTLAGKLITQLVPTLKAANKLNKDTLAKKMERPSYAENQAWNRKWGAIFILPIFAVIVPFTLTLQSQPWWQMLGDIVVILFFYDFFYYLMHRFLFHDSSFLGGPLMWVHAVHHRQHNPCRQDSSYIHPLEVAMGLGLFVASIFVLSLLMGPFHVVTFVVTWTAFSQINLHNHTLWTSDRFPFKYMNYLSRMHHNHHAKFTGGNFATITLLYDWMFGTLDDGNGWQKRAAAQRKAATEANAQG
ncbi:sterol desaturase family protein [Novosphingobium sp. JCM 18896]|uniref:sterol desaturase family protein n=1 Tax=Novosphingobium sp. JCM 18896 TaxID=2989731 RepID=UPI002222D7B3|nr:sterol desaturase family protein [Novosphingobium sp. JCM 18896]MCW1429674.1 sterol desaturase family protein [Novosphingobium sp. JCM 18896]